MTGRFLLRRAAGLLPSVAGIVTLGFLLVHLAPGDPVVALGGEHGDAAYYEFMRERFGLDRALPEQLITYARRVLAGDLGTSYVYGRSVISVIAERVPATLLLTGSALLLALLVAIPLGTLAGARERRHTDTLINGAALALYSAPLFWIGQVALLLFSLRLGWLPVQGMTSAGADDTWLVGAGDVARHLVLPVLVLATHEIAALLRITRAGVAHELTLDHVRTARAKGLTERRTIIRHALPRALFPVLTVVGSRAGGLVAGAVVTEIVFGWPGMGRLLLASLQARDIPVILGIFMVVSFAVVLLNFLTDLVYAARDKRIELR
jgi:peptide/nickel transport system permease protein